MKNKIFKFLKEEYNNSEVTSGEFIHTVTIPSMFLGEVVNKKSVIEGIQQFLDWDAEEDEDFETEKFDIIRFGNTWYTTEHFYTYEDFYNFKGINYPTKILNVTIDEHKDNWVHSYLVAPESLYTSIEEYTQETNDERFMDSIDSEVYHYIEDQYWDLSNEVLAKEHLDIPMTLTKDE